MDNFLGLNNFKFLKQHKIEWKTLSIVQLSIIHSNYPFKLSILLYSCSKTIDAFLSLVCRALLCTMLV